MIRLAQCCTPPRGHHRGLRLRGRAHTVHKIGCPSIASIKDFAERSIEVEWETVSPKSTRRFQVTARKTSNLFSEIEGALKKYGGHLIEGKLEESELELLRGFFPPWSWTTARTSAGYEEPAHNPAVVNIQAGRCSLAGAALLLQRERSFSHRR